MGNIYSYYYPENTSQSKSYKFGCIQDEYDERFFRNGQVIGAKHGGSVHQPTITYSTIPNLGAGRLPDPGPRYGESRPPVIYDFTENPFNRAPRYGGGLNIPGAPGNIQTLPYITATPSFEIPGGQSPYRFGPYLPYRGEERKEEETPFIPIPLQQAQGLPMGFQNKYVS